jgi:hypothetical protein
MEIHIGEQIRIKSSEKRIKPVELARLISTTKQNVYSIFRRKSIDTDQLVQISKALEFNFFEYYNDLVQGALVHEEESLYQTTSQRLRNMELLLGELRGRMDKFEEVYPIQKS